VRKNRSNAFVVEVMPRVRIGSPDAGDTLAHPVIYGLNRVRDPEPAAESGDKEKSTPSPGDGEKSVLVPSDYERILERIYFSVVTELYRQIKLDVKNKIRLLPTTYSRAVALFYEAEDYARSNTLDGYESAGDLYWQAAALLDRRLRPLPGFMV